MKKQTILLVLLALCLAVTGALAETAETTGKDAYENADFGYGFSLDGWHALTGEEIGLSVKAAGQVLDEETVKTAEAGMEHMLLVATAAGLQTVELAVEDLGGDTETTYEQGIVSGDVLAGKLDELKLQLEATGFSNLQAEVADTVLGGQPCQCILAQFDMLGYPCFMKLVCVAKDRSLYTINAMSMISDQTEEVMARFYPLQ